MPNKYRHVQTAGQAPHERHLCGWPGCDAMVPGPMWGCAWHWQQLPSHIRSRIWNAYEIGQEADPRLVTHEYEEATSAAKQWIRDKLQALGPALRP